MATGSMDNTAKLWDVGVAQRKGHGDTVGWKILRDSVDLLVSGKKFARFGIRFQKWCKFRFQQFVF